MRRTRRIRDDRILVLSAMVGQVTGTLQGLINHGDCARPTSEFVRTELSSFCDGCHRNDCACREGATPLVGSERGFLDVFARIERKRGIVTHWHGHCDERELWSEPFSPTRKPFAWERLE